MNFLNSILLARLMRIDQVNQSVLKLLKLPSIRQAVLKNRNKIQKLYPSTLAQYASSDLQNTDLNFRGNGYTSGSLQLDVSASARTRFEARIVGQ